MQTAPHERSGGSQHRLGARVQQESASSGLSRFHLLVPLNYPCIALNLPF